jgi:hypothetical protein
MLGALSLYHRVSRGIGEPATVSSAQSRRRQPPAAQSAAVARPRRLRHINKMLRHIRHSCRTRATYGTCIRNLRNLLRLQGPAGCTHIAPHTALVPYSCKRAGVTGTKVQTLTQTRSKAPQVAPHCATYGTRAVLVQKCWRYWHKRRNTDADSQRRLRQIL